MEPGVFFCYGESYIRKEEGERGGGGRDWDFFSLLGRGGSQQLNPHKKSPRVVDKEDEKNCVKDEKYLSFEDEIKMGFYVKMRDNHDLFFFSEVGGLAILV